MGYEIPSQLEYREKIIFGLDFKQLLYATFFALIDFVIFFKTGWNIYLKCSLLIPPTILAVGFMFFHLDKQLLNIYRWLRFRQTRDIPKFIGVKKIDTYIHAKKRVAIIRVSPINFNIKTTEEKETITSNFLRFMNAIDFPIQILMKTEELKLDPYLTKQETPKKYRALSEKNTLFLKDLVTKNHVMDRVFYLIIPEKENLEIQVQVCMEWIRALNLRCDVLGTEQMKELVTVNGALLTNRPNVLAIDTTFHRIIYAHGYPRTVEPGFLDKIVSCSGNFDFSLHIDPFDVETMMVNVNKQLQKQKADLYSLNIKGIINPALEIQYNDTRKVLEELQKGNDKLFNVSLYIDCKAVTEKELNLITKKVESTLNSLMILPKKALFQMDRGYKSMLPLADNALNVTRNVTSRGLSAFFPFTSPFFQTDEQGVWLGMNKNGIPIIKDIFQLSNPNGVILAQSGGGKSFFAKLLISRYLLNGTKVMVIDPQGEYTRLVERFQGQRVLLSRNSQTIINPLDLMGHDYAEKRLALIDLMQVMLGEMSEIQKAFIDKALTLTYEKKGISIDSTTWNNEPPILADLLHTLESMEKRATVIEKSSIHSLINRLSIYVDGVFSFLNQHTNINFENTFVCFDIGDIPRPVKPVIMFLVLDYVYMKMRINLERKILLIDEAWSLLSRTEDASYIFEIVKTCRKFNLGLLLINQEVEGLLTSEAGKSVLANSAYTVLMKQKPAVIHDVCKVFHLSHVEKEYLLTAAVGEGILIIDNDHFELKVVASEEEHRLITTNADELIQQQKKVSSSKGQCTTKKEIPKNVNDTKPELQKVTINVDSEKGFYRHRDLNLDEIKYLLAKKYVIVERKSLVSGKVEKFLLKPRFNESVNHFFVTRDIADYLEQKGVKVTMFVTKKPDLTFTLQGKKIAIEVETGTVYEKARMQLLEKVKELNKEYDAWFFVVTNRNYAKKYRTLGSTIEMRYLEKRLQRMLKIDTEKPSKKSAFVVEDDGKILNNSHPI